MLRNVFEVTEWQTPCTFYRTRAVDGFRLRRKSYKEGVYRMYRVDGFTYFRVNEEIPIMALESLEKDGEWREWMIDDPFNFLAINRYCEAMHGNVLTSGLGLGIAARALSKNPNITSVTVVEREQAVIDLVGSYLPPSVTIVHDDFWAYVDAHRRRWFKLGGERWDGVLLDIWRTTGIAEHERVRQEEVIPARDRLKRMLPRTELVMFGFAEQSEIDVQLPYLEKAHRAPEYTTGRVGKEFAL